MSEATVYVLYSLRSRLLSMSEETLHVRGYSLWPRLLSMAEATLYVRGYSFCPRLLSMSWAPIDNAKSLKTETGLSVLQTAQNKRAELTGQRDSCVPLQGTYVSHDVSKSRGYRSNEPSLVPVKKLHFRMMALAPPFGQLE